MNRFKSNLFYFEMVILLRKVGLVAAMTFVSGSAYIRAGAAMTWLLANFGSHVRVQPYATRAHNVLEAACLILVCILLQEAVMLQDDTWDDKVQDGIMILTLVVLFACIGAGVCYDVWFRSKEAATAKTYVVCRLLRMLLSMFDDVKRRCVCVCLIPLYHSFAGILEG